MFHLLTDTHKESLESILDRTGSRSLSGISRDLEALIGRIRHDIPQKKKGSYGRYSVVKKLGEEICRIMSEKDLDIIGFSEDLFRNGGGEPFVRSLAVQIRIRYAVLTGDPYTVLPFLEEAAADRQWEVRECSSGFVRVLTAKYPAAMKELYLKMVVSDDPLRRRFASESLRPVVENRWLHNNPDYAFDILCHLFRESDDYPRTSVGNNLSDWMRVDREYTFPVIEELVRKGDENSRWIAYRACRNLVKTEPERVFDLFGIDEYRYKNRLYRRPSS